ncbi:hypothetical protein G7Y89_g4090 [Cudoniella acicularis]|uniref:Uncharacterized protein n=1 Tax=Cudoniella acicularis TaxID=354080 RepID=A0A8H4W7S4_9HELO|nr:hypothetical protein G7Y89_g4090 [Cudoniella acicularis]
MFWKHKQSGFSSSKSNEVFANGFLVELKTELSAIGVQGIENPIDAPIRTLSPLSHHAMNALKISSPPSYDQINSSKNPHTTIRPVNSEPVQFEALPSEPSGRRSKSDPPIKYDSAAMPHSTKTLPAVPTHSSPPLAWQNTMSGNGLVRTISAEFGLTRKYSNNNLHIAEDSSTSSNGNATSLVIGPGASQWSSAVGRANLGKSGRVIERLMGENDMLKRDLHIERLRAEESKQAVKMAEGKMEALTSEYEGKLHEAAINKTLLRRKERQVEDLKSQVEGEKRRANAAVEGEHMWRDAMEKLEEDSKRKVEEAQTYAALMEGRNNAMTSHWKEQGAEVSRTVSKLGKEIETLVEDRRGDDRRMNMLQDLCDQQTEQLLFLIKEKESIGAAFEAYKREQEESLAAIKEKAKAQEQLNDEIIRESQKVLGELKWALAVKKNTTIAD